MSAAVSMAKELGAQKLAVPSRETRQARSQHMRPGRSRVFIFMPDDTRANVVECEQTG